MNKVRTCPILVREIIKGTGFHHAQQTINIRDNIRSILNLNILLLNIKLKSEKLIEYYLPKYPQHNQENILQASVQQRIKPHTCKQTEISTAQSITQRVHDPMWTMELEKGVKNRFLKP